MSTVNILFFTCFNQRSVQLESSILYFHQKGYNVSLLTTCKKGSLHAALENKGVKTDEIAMEGKGPYYYWKLSRHLVKYCRKHKIDFLHSHLQIPNFVSCLARPFINATVFTVRHNSDVIRINGSSKEKLMERLVNRMSRHIIAISDKVKEQLIEAEKVNPKKIHRINNGYDFSFYDQLILSPQHYLEIKKKYGGDPLIVSPGRFIPTKRHELTIEGIQQLQAQGINARLIIMGDGPGESRLKELIAEKGLSDAVFLLPYQENISDYLKAADLVVLLSESEASNNTVKEAGYFEKPVIVCSSVGDFDDYIVHDRNGFLVPKKQPLTFFTDCVKDLHQHQGKALTVGQQLKKTVVATFDIQKIGRQYEDLQNLILSK